MTLKINITGPPTIILVSPEGIEKPINEYELLEELVHIGNKKLKGWSLLSMDREYTTTIDEDGSICDGTEEFIDDLMIRFDREIEKLNNITLGKIPCTLKQNQQALND